MKDHRPFRRSPSLVPNPLNPAWKTAKKLLAPVLLTLTCLAQIPDQPAQESDSQNQTQAEAKVPIVAVPSGTRIALVLTQPIQSRHVHHGDDIYAQIISPVNSGDEVVIPPGTFVQGKVDNLKREGARGILRLQSMSMTLPDGYVVPVSGPITLESDDGYAWKDPGTGRVIGAFALPAAGAGLGALIGHAAANSKPETITASIPPGCTGPPPGCLSSSLTTLGSTGKSTVIGAAVGGTIGAVASIALIFGSHSFYLDVGSPVQMVLQQPISLPEDQVAAAVQQSEEPPAAEEPNAPRPQAVPPPTYDDPNICYTPGTPGTPDVDIPGAPATADSPGTPPIHIAGIPPTPPSAHPCP